MDSKIKPAFIQNYKLECCRTNNTIPLHSGKRSCVLPNLMSNYNWFKRHSSFRSITILHLWDDSYCINPSFVSFFKLSNKLKNTSDKVHKTTTLTLHQQHYFDFSPTIFAIPIPAAPIVFTTIAQEKAEIFFKQ